MLSRIYIKRIAPYWYITPSLILLAFVFLYPIIQIFTNSFYRFSGGEKVFIGFFNYTYLIIKDTLSHEAFLNNLKLLLTIPVLLILAIFFAVVFHEGIKGSRFYQALVFIPLALSIVVVGITFNYILRVDGILNYLLKKIGLEIIAKNWLGDSKFAIYTVMAVIIWKELAFGVILFMARLSSINEDIYDAAKIDGANWFRTLIHITIPQMRNVIDFYIIYNVMIMFAWVFNYVFIITGGGPGNSTMILELNIYKYAFQRHLMGMASALAVLLFLIVIIFIYLQFRLRRGFMEGDS